ncbi:MAG: septal ring lytic transglycosylase RlpA family protein [Thermoanaerobaculia bacterium]|nr:septal ring lytic transglycosylase RlpA family protein [Thermoanaerobaculia bacterium]
MLKRLLCSVTLPLALAAGGCDDPIGDSAGGEPVLETSSGDATYYADIFEGRKTASGIPFRQNELVAAHRAYPFGTVLRVTNERNDRSVVVRVVDRGPFGTSANKKRTVIDLSRRAAEALDFIREGRATVRVDVLEWGEGLPSS